MPTCRQNNMPHYNISKHHPQLIKQSTMDLSLDNHIQKLKLKWPECPSQPIFSVNLPAQKYWMPDDKSWVRRTALALRLVMTQASCYLRCPRETKKKNLRVIQFPRTKLYTYWFPYLFLWRLKWVEIGIYRERFPINSETRQWLPTKSVHS